MSNPQFDVVISGAGTAGCASAIELRKSNLKVCLVDPTGQPSPYKIGETIPGSSARLLHRIGIHSLEKWMGEEKWSRNSGNASCWGSNYWEYRNALYNPEGGGWHILRHVFDKKLKDLALSQGVKIYRTKVGKIKSDQKDGGHIIKLNKSPTSAPLELESPWLIDATGRSRSIVLQFDTQKIKSQVQMAIVFWIRAPENDTDLWTRIKTIDQGWYYTSLLPDNTRVVSFHGHPLTIAKWSKNTTVFFETLNTIELLPFVVTQKEVKHGPVITHADMSRLDRFCGKNWIAAGDSAISFAPLAAQGIFFALYSGIKSAETIIQCGINTNSSKIYLQKYHDRLHQIYTTAQQLRMQHYTAESRFTKNQYWKQYFNNKAGIK